MLDMFMLAGITGKGLDKRTKLILKSIVQPCTKIITITEERGRKKKKIKKRREKKQRSRVKKECLITQ